MTTLAAVLRQEGHPLVLEEVTVRDPGPDEVLIAVAATGICASDLHLVDGTLLIPGVGPHPLPVVPGHEAAGIVERVGRNVSHISPGDHVIVNVHPGCGNCVNCMLGKASHCTSGRPGELPAGASRFSVDGRPIYQMVNCGSFAERTVIPARGCVPIPAEMPLDKACLIGCGVATAYGAVFRTAAVKPGDSVLVVGIGGVGLNVVQCAHLAGATTIVAVDLGKERLERAMQFGATHCVDASDAGWPEQVRRLTAGGADRAFEVISTPSTVRGAFDATKDDGLLTIVGLAPPGSTVEIPTVPNRTIMRSGLRWTQPAVDFPALVSLYLGGRLKLDELIVARRSITDVNEVMDGMRNGEYQGRVVLV